MLIKNSKAIYRFIGGCLLVSIVIGCSSRLHYPKDLAKNLEVRKKVNTGSIFSGVQIWAKIYDIEGRCKTKYKGNIHIKDKKTLIGLPVNKSNYIVFAFDTGNVMSGYNNTVSESTVIHPLKGYQYRADVQYIDDTYYVGIYKRKITSNKWKQLKIRSLPNCR